MNLAASTRATYVPDIQGSVIAALDASSGVLTKTGYRAYGESSTTGGTFRYTGARIDAETNGLYNFRARMYSPLLGRFMQADPMGAAGGINLYAYVNNDPLNNVDPTGLLTLTLGLGYSAYAGTGGELSFGLAVSFPVPYFDPGAKFDVGGYITAGGGVGANVGSAVSVGAYSGDILNGGLRGALVNTGIGVGPIGAQASFVPNTGAFVGGAVSFGPRAPIPIFGSTSITDTGVFSLREAATNVVSSVAGLRASSLTPASPNK